MLIWKNTTILDTCSDGLSFTDIKNSTEIILMGSQPIDINKFPNLKGIFRAGVGRDNVPEKEAMRMGLLFDILQKKRLISFLKKQPVLRVV